MTKINKSTTILMKAEPAVGSWSWFLFMSTLLNVAFFFFFFITSDKPWRVYTNAYKQFELSFLLHCLSVKQSRFTPAWREKEPQIMRIVFITYENSSLRLL